MHAACDELVMVLALFHHRLGDIYSSPDFGVPYNLGINFHSGKFFLVIFIINKRKTKNFIFIMPSYSS